MLNFPLPASGALDSEELNVLSGITKWMDVNSQAIYGTRPRKIFGEGPGTETAAQNSAFNESKHGVELLGFTGKLEWSQNETGLSVSLPQQKPSDYAVVFKVEGA